MRSHTTRGVDVRLLAASKSGDLPKALNLVRRGANVKARSPKNETPLHCAARSGSFALVRYFVNLGADVNARTLRGASVLRFATQSKNRNLVCWLYEDKKARFADAADLNAALFGALAKRDYPMARLLVDYGADVRALGWRSQTTLHVAARCGDVRAVVWLLEDAKLAVDVKDELGKTPLDLAATDEIRECLQSRLRRVVENGENAES
ncbi:MAG: ankyrin repeat domain-containing protein [Thermoguttaceae bacterium]|nr:ankyrin repeat domain-containing protein [Thermoguttaceae bacterium]MBR4103646.1 ankyrin repeat domain-containing protein [Thermoguttaceae bacterium]